jgi:hypothetical protein
MATGAVIARILTQYSDKGSKAAQKDIARLTKKFDDFGKRARKSFALAITATAALSVKIGTDAVQAAIDDAKSQAVLANALKATADATGKLTTQAEDYIKVTMFRTNTADEQLRASLAQLIIATGDLSQAERLQTIALDVAAASGRDLAATTIAITRAQQGNVTALKRLSPELSGLIKQGMTAESVFALLETTYGGTAEALADLDPLTKLRLAYGETLETLGTALLPVVKEFAEYIISDVVPAVDEWIAANGEELRTALRDIVDGVVALSGTFKTFASFIKDNEFLIKLALQLFALGRGAKFVGKFMTKLDEVIGKGAKVFKNFGKSAENLRDKFFDLVKTDQDGSFGRFVSLIGTAVEWIAKLIGGFLALGAATNTVKSIFKSLFGIEEKRSNQIFDITKQTYGGAAAEKYKAEVAAAAAKKTAAARAVAAAAAAKAAAQERKDALAQARIDKAVAAIRKTLNIKGDNAIDKETDIIQLNAAEALLKRQKDADKADLERVQRLKDEILSLAVRNDLAKRYQDILQALADQKIDTKEIAILAKMWGVPTEAVEAYLITLFALEDATITDDEIVNLAKKWGSTQAQAAQYLDFFQALNDGILSDDEIVKLKAKWKLTEDQVRMYADFVGVVNDGKLTDAEIIKIKDKWKLTTDQVVEYILKVGAPVSYNGSMLTTAQAAELAWKNALAALEAFLRKQGSATAVVPPTPTVVPPTTTVTPQGPCGTSRPYYNYYTGECVASPSDIKPRGSSSDSSGLGGTKTDSSAASAIAAAVAKATGDTAAAAIAAAGVTPSALASEESGAIGAASIAAQLRAAEEAVRISSSLAAFKAKEAADLAASQAAADALDYDERFRFRNSSTMDNAKGIVGSSMANTAPTIIVNVAGTVTAEEDLVQVVRAGLLRGQYNGQSITLEAI